MFYAKATVMHMNAGPSHLFVFAIDITAAPELQQEDPRVGTAHLIS